MSEFFRYAFLIAFLGIGIGFLALLAYAHVRWTLEDRAREWRRYRAEIERHAGRPLELTDPWFVRWCDKRRRRVLTGTAGLSRKA